MSGKEVKPYKQIVRYAIRGLKALDKAIPEDVRAHAVVFGLDPEQLPPRFIHPSTAKSLVNDVYPGLFDDNDVEVFDQRFVPVTHLYDI